MLRNLAVCLGESAVFSAVYWLALFFVVRGLRRLGRTFPPRAGVAYLALWLGTFVVDCIGTAWRGPDFVVLYKLAGLAPVAALIFWVLAAYRSSRAAAVDNR